MIDVAKNFLALIVSTAVWTSGFASIISIYYAVVEFDVFYLGMLVLCIFVAGAGILLGKYNVRVQAALEIPFGILNV